MAEIRRVVVEVNGNRVVLCNLTAQRAERSMISDEFDLRIEPVVLVSKLEGSGSKISVLTGPMICRRETKLADKSGGGEVYGGLKVPFE